jgi:hypothetical protein
LYREILAREAGKLQDLSTLRTNHTDDLEPHWQDDMDRLCTVEFLPTDDPGSDVCHGHHRVSVLLERYKLLLDFNESLL